jgi:hypothetical protein
MEPLAPTPRPPPAPETPAVTAWAPTEIRLFTVVGWAATVIGWFSVPVGIESACCAVTGLFGSALLLAAPVFALGAWLAVRIGSCGRAIRERDVSAWPDVRDTASLSIAGPATGAFLVLILARLTGASMPFALATTLWFVVPVIALTPLLSRCSDVMKQKQQRR